MIKTENLTFQYDENEEVFNFPDISLSENEHLLILGKSGIGKTTFLHLLAGLLSPIQGEIQIGEVTIHKLSKRQIDKFRGKNIGLVFQKNHAIQSLNVTENLEARLFFAKQTLCSETITEILKQLDIADCKDKKTQELSEGQLQRLGIAMALVHGPKIILADEPTSSLDDENCQNVMNLLIQQAIANNANLIVITHDSRIKPMFKNQLTL